MSKTIPDSKPRHPKQRKQSDRREESCERILDAAEELFGRRGYYGVTVREIAVASNVDTSLLHYYFGSKQSLFEAVIDRRAALVNENRAKSLEEYERTHSSALTAEGIIRAYLKPTFDLMMTGDAGLLNYGALIAKINSTSFRDYLGASDSPFDSVIHKMIDLLRRVRPECSDTELYWFYHLISGAITLSLAQTGRVDTLSRGQCQSSDFEAILHHMTTVFGQGFSAVSPPVRTPIE